MESISPSDRRVIQAQIGRRPRGIVDVPVRCTHGYPQVIRVRPLIEGKPFPTTLWLTCPFLVREIARLEAEGWIDRLERRMADDEALRAAMDEAHARYVEARTGLLGDTERRASVLPSGGIGGISDTRRLKCLHLHVAHDLVEGNPIGRIVRRMLSSGECRAGEAICSALTEGGADPVRRIDR